MAFLAVAAPYLAAASAVYSAGKSAQTSLYNAKVAQNESNLAVNQGAAQEGMVIRAGRQQIGRQAAAFGAAGVGYGGSSETALDNSAVNDELDALNTKYHGTLTGYGYGVESQNMENQGNQQSLLAGAALLKGIGSNYTAGMPQMIQPSTAQNNPQLLPGDSG
jgi:hypothetical protein